MKVTHLKDPVYSFNVNVVSGCSYSKYVELAKKYGGHPGEDKGSATKAEFYKTPNGFYFLYLSKPSPALLAHELVHLVQIMLDTKGIPVNLETTEVQGYHVEWWFDQVYKKIK